MNITILCSDPNHPVVPQLRNWADGIRRDGHEVELLHGQSGLRGGDILFLVSCARLIRPADRALYRATLVLHASDLPEGRGWSPHIWAVLQGAAGLTVSLIEAADPVDSGAIWLQTKCPLEGHELLPEIEAKLFAAETALMSEAIRHFSWLQPRPQSGVPGAYLRRRTPADSRLDPGRTIAEQFDLLRVVDGERFPAFFVHRGHRYVVKIEKADA